MTLKGTKTASNLITAFAGESQATMRYTIAAKIADKEGFVQIKQIYEETAGNEKEHAKTFYKYLKDEFKLDAIELNPDFTAFPVVEHDTSSNLLGALEGENEEAEDMYPRFAKEAKEEGFDEIALTFENIAKVEGHHRDRFKALKENVDNHKVFEKDEKVIWKCLNCGFIMEGKVAPTICPACKHPQKYFAIANFNY